MVLVSIIGVFPGHAMWKPKEGHGTYSLISLHSGAIEAAIMVFRFLFGHPNYRQSLIIQMRQGDSL